VKYDYKQKKNSFDNYLRERGEFFTMRGHQIRPTPDFVERTLAKITEAHEHRMMMTKFMFAFCMFIPIILREVWFFTRRDYFAVDRWPFGSYVSSTYHLLISTSAAMYMLVLAAVCAFIYLWGYHNIFSPTFKFFGNIFSRSARARA